MEFSMFSSKMINKTAQCFKWFSYNTARISLTMEVQLCLVSALPPVETERLVPGVQKDTSSGRHRVKQGSKTTVEHDGTFFVTLLHLLKTHSQQHERQS